ncbi:hypothetical protein AXF42_Ash006119 [Apostasia shenzhenica]|uniref:GRF-type domain-containing protein n=1 Tax=Apostasia shenzhenica TaxID=1088818 RepID=A0A2I0B091_9ASPA|nr:hypothetical protein AXF42_Ash006119 [Apostasia shenzhenica]
MVVCSCNRDCGLYTTRQGENTGRRFYRCTRYKSLDGCDFFRWVDDAHHSSVDIKYQLFAMEERINRKFRRNELLLKMCVIVIVIQFILLLFKM